MKAIISCILIYLLFSCNNNTDNKKKPDSISVNDRDTLAFSFLKDDLYKDQSGNIAFKAIDNTDPRHPEDRFITTVWNADPNDSIDNGKMEMKDVIDIPSFRNIQGIYYRDRKHFYIFNQMADGGTFGVIENIDPKTFVVLSPSYAKDNRYAYHGSHIIKGADVKTFKPYPKVSNGDTLWEYAKDKNHFYYFGDIIETSELESNKLK